MGAALEVVTGYLTTSSLAAGTYAALVPENGQSYTIRATPTSQAGSLLGPWAQANLAGYFQVKSARMHDTTIGTTFYAQPASSVFSAAPLAPLDYDEPAWSTDILIVQFTPLVTISGAETDILSIPVYYPNLPGIQANFMTWAQIQAMVNAGNKIGDHYVSWVRPSSAGTAGIVGTGVAINSTNDQFKANHSYALLGYLSGTKVASVLVQGVDTGNLYVGGPGTIDTDVTRNWFVNLSQEQGFATIPVIQANNKGATFVYVVDGQTTSTASTIGLIWMDLGVLAGINTLGLIQVTVTSDTGLYRNWGYNAGAQSSAPTFTTATAVQLFTDKDCVVYVELDSAAGSTPVVAIGPDDSTAIQVAGSALAMGTGIVVTVILPAAWFIQLTFTSDITVTAVVVTD